MRDDFLKRRSEIYRETEEMAQYLGVSDRKHRGPARPMFRTDDKKYEYHEFMLALVNKLKEIEGKLKKRKAIDGNKGPSTKKVD